MIQSYNHIPDYTIQHTTIYYNQIYRALEHLGAADSCERDCGCLSQRSRDRTPESSHVSNTRELAHTTYDLV